MGGQSEIVAVLGPTNTGKTHHAIQRMLAHRTGVIGLPLRLLAREVYERVVALRGPSVVALVTGEERIVPARVHYWVCTVEAMPTDIGADFLAVDEIQLCADPERGHVFTDRLLHARGQKETLFLGSDSMKPAIAALVPEARFRFFERFSELTWTGSKRTSRLAPKTAIVGFSVENLYALGELLRRQKGGVAVVMGALSPRTRNAQVALYQNGDVDYLVATDAIGMGLNLDIDHVAFSSLVKFDGRRMRALMPHELGQIAGRAGRYRNDGSFGTTGEAGPLPAETVRAISEHRFAPVRRLEWRNRKLAFGSLAQLVGSLETAPGNPWLSRSREADDLIALKTLADSPELAGRLTAPADLRLLWEVCRIPDFRGISRGEHARLLERIFVHLQDRGRLPPDWLAEQVRRLDSTNGDIDTLSRRLAFIRTWTYVSQRRGWVEDENHWREATRAVEDRLSDALHGALTKRFVDRRTSVLMRRLKQKEALVAEVANNGEVTVEGQFVGRLEGFRFRQDTKAGPDEARTLRAAAFAALAPEFQLRSDRFYNAPDPEIDFTEQGGLMWGEHAVGKLVRGEEPLKPVAVAFVDEEAGPEVARKVQRRLQHFIDRRIAALFEPLLAMARDEELNAPARGFAFRLSEGFGIIERGRVAAEVKALDQDTRAMLRKHGVRFGQFTIFMPLLLKPAPTRLRLVLWALARGFDSFPQSPPPGLVTIPAQTDAPAGYHTMSGYRRAGARAIRIDMLERLADMLRDQDSRAGFEATADMLSITGMTLEQFADLLQGLGYRAERGERQKARLAPDPASQRAGTAGAAGPDATAANAPEPDGAGKDGAGTGTDGPATGSGDSESAASDAAASGACEAAQADAAPGPAPGSKDAEPDMEVFYIFRWAHNRPERGAPRAKSRRPGQKARKRSAGPSEKPGNKARSFAARPPKKDRIDPDNPFAAALMGLKDDS